MSGGLRAAAIFAFLVAARAATYAHADEDMSMEMLSAAVDDSLRASGDLENEALFLLQKRASIGHRTVNTREQDDRTAATAHQFQLFMEWEEERDQFLIWKREHDPQEEQHRRSEEFERLFPGVCYVGEQLLSVAESIKRRTVHAWTSDVRSVSSTAGKAAEKHAALLNTVPGKTKGPVGAVEKAPGDAKNDTKAAQSGTQAAQNGAQGVINNAEGIAANDTQAVVGDVEGVAADATKTAQSAEMTLLEKFRKLGYGDYFIGSGVLLMLFVWAVLGWRYVFEYWHWYGGRLYTFLYNHIHGHAQPSAENNYMKISREKGHKDLILERGVAQPAPMLFRQQFAELTEGQQYVMKLAEIDSQTWDDAVQTHKDQPQIAFSDAINKTWTDFSEFQQMALSNIDMGEDVWNMEDPENLAIHRKMWKHLSAFEQNLAFQLGIDGSNGMGRQWNKRENPLWYTPYHKLSEDQQTALRKLRFLKTKWHPYHDVEVPSMEEDALQEVHMIIDAIRKCKRRLVHSILVAWILTQLVWLLWIIWDLGLLQTLWAQFQSYIILGLVVLGCICCLIQLLSPLFVWVEEHVVQEIRVIVAHVKDVWAMISNHLPKKVVNAVNAGCARCGEAAHCHCYTAFKGCTPANCVNGCENCLPFGKKRGGATQETSCLPWRRSAPAPKARAKASAEPATGGLAVPAASASNGKESETPPPPPPPPPPPASSAADTSTASALDKSTAPAAGESSAPAAGESSAPAAPSSAQADPSATPASGSASDLYRQESSIPVSAISGAGPADAASAPVSVTPAAAEKASPAASTPAAQALLQGVPAPSKDEPSGTKAS